MQRETPNTANDLADVRRIIAEDLPRQMIVPEDQIDRVIDQILKAMQKAKAEGRELDEIELTTYD